VAIVVAAGRGERFGSAKQFLRLGGTTLVERAVERAATVCQPVVVVLPPGTDWPGTRGVIAVPGGDSRSASVRAGLAATPERCEIVVVHDAARPLAGPDTFRAVVEAVRAGADAAVPALPVADTLKRVDGSRVVETVARDALVSVQTPQAFRADALRRAHAAGGVATDDAALVEEAGGCVVVVPGDARNLKITQPVDLAIAEALLAEEQA
jgi:2-C-methyl-D-erythritol 4-phosphate cytidylyltransferase